jgi:hypothetical protein
VTLVSIDGDAVSIQVDRASAEVTTALVLRARGVRPARVAELLARAARRLVRASLLAEGAASVAAPPAPRRAAPSRRSRGRAA